VRKLLLSLVSISVLFICPSTTALTMTYDDIVTDPTSDANGSPNILICAVTVRSNLTLTLNPEIKAQLGSYQSEVGILNLSTNIYYNGKLIVEGVSCCPDLEK